MPVFKTLVLAWSGSLVGLPAVLFLLGYVPENIENRSRASLPQFTSSSLADTDFYAELARYLSDRLPIRAFAIRADSAIDLWLFSDSPVTSVIKGRDGWYFARESVIRECRSRQEHARFTPDRVALVANYLSGIGSQLVVTIVPDKRSIYPQHLSRVARMGAGCADETRQYVRGVLANTGGVYLDIYDLFERQAERPDHIPLYSPLDTHWTTYGSGLFVGRFIESTESWSLEDATLELRGEDTGGGELSRMMAVSLPDTRGGRYIWSRPGVREGDDHAIPHGAPGEAYRLFGGVAEGSARLSARKLVVIHDSFIYYAWDHLARFFENVLYIHWGVIDNPEVAGLIRGADLVLVESVERFAFERFVDFFSADTVQELRDAGDSDRWEQLLTTRDGPK